MLFSVEEKSGSVSTLCVNGKKTEDKLASIDDDEPMLVVAILAIMMTIDDVR